MTAVPVRVGVLGATSRIYRNGVGPAITAVDGVTVVHEGSRGGGRPFTEGVTTSEGSDAYDRVVADDDVDVVYVALPNHLHEEWTVAAAENGKHVLCEKPLAIDAESAQRMAAAADRAGTVLLEAYMSPYHPRSLAIADAVDEGALGGPLREAHARFTGTLAKDDHRFSVANGGGALLDIGIYCLEPMLTAAGWDEQPPAHVDAVARRVGDGIDESTTALIGLADGATLTFHVDIAAPDQQRLQLTGPRAAIEVETHATPDHNRSGYVLRGRDGSIEQVPTATGDSYEGMVRHLLDIIAGDAASRRPPSRSVALARVLDKIRDASA